MFVDPDLLQYDEVWAAAGTWNDNFGAAPADIVRVAGGVVADLKRDCPQCLAFDPPFGLNDFMSADAPHHIELTAVLWAAPEGGFSALNPETGTVSEGETEAEALANLTEATELYLEEFPLPSRQKPVITTIRVADVA